LNTGDQQRQLKTAAGGEKRKTPRGENSGLRIKPVPASAQHKDIKKHTSNSQALGDGDSAQSPDTILPTVAVVTGQHHQQSKR